MTQLTPEQLAEIAERASQGDEAHYKHLYDVRALLSHVSALTTEIAALREVILWALGERGEFPERPADFNERKYKPWYWWRNELRIRYENASPKVLPEREG